MASVLVAIACMLGLLGFVVGAIVVGFFLMFTFHELVARPGIGAVDAMRGSVALVKAHPSESFVMLVVSIVIVALTSSVLPGIGGLIGGPFCMLLGSLFYDRLAKKAASVL
ncbi:MAG: hypothetical protein HYV07_32395 [Deltaproteobacteria bacterium]|nr:hypothetical protein [Deltaproteobacteria bacterium]